MHTKLFFLSILIYLFSSLVYADEASLKESLNTYFPDEKIEILKKIPSLQLYEVVIGNQLFYVDEKVNYFFSGYLFDLKNERNLTEERLQEIRNMKRVDIDSLPLEYAIKEIKGNGKRKLIIFSDPNCGYCKRLEKELIQINNVTIYTLLYPILKGSKEIAEGIWCSDNRLEAWKNYMFNDIKPIGNSCETPVNTLLQTGKKNGLNSTPTIVFAGGTIVPGMISAELIERKLRESAE